MRGSPCARNATVYGNIGATGAYHSGTPQPTQLLGSVPPGAQVDIRYVAGSDQWVMATWHGQRFAGGTARAFFPRGCLA